MGLLAWLVWTFVAFQVVITGNDKEPELRRGDHVLVGRWSYGLRWPFERLFGYHRSGARRPAAGDFMLFNDPSDSTTSVISGRVLCVGQCMALPGDTVWLEWHSPDDPSAVNPRRYPFVVPGKGQRVNVQPWNAALLANTLRVHEGRDYFWDGRHLRTKAGEKVVQLAFRQDYVWAEARGMSGVYDSRVYGFVPLSHLIGRLICITYGSPFSSDRVLIPVEPFEQ